MDMKAMLIEVGKEKSLEIMVNRVYCVGYASRNQEKVREHIKELEKIGVPAPPRTPTVYSIDSDMLTSNNEIKVQGNKTSGEVEAVLFVQKDKIFVSIGSDHTDRELETISIEKSKQVCKKPVSNEVWDYDAIKDHWDSLILRAWITDGKGKHIYQEGQLKELLSVPDLLNVIKHEISKSIEGVAIYSGTVPAQDGLASAAIWDLELEDPILKRKIKHHYEVKIIAEETES